MTHVPKKPAPPGTVVIQSHASRVKAGASFDVGRARGRKETRREAKNPRDAGYPIGLPERTTSDISQVWTFYIIVGW
jgi:hypothetical protein